MARIVVLGASGFLGSHLCDELIARGDEVVGLDDLSSSTGLNLKGLESEKHFTFLKGDIADGIPVRGKRDGSGLPKALPCALDSPPPK
jgi:dTDP-glucose 4,6-dehydratase